MAKRKKKAPVNAGEMLVCTNPKATRDYDIQERIECGMVLVGSEVKSMRLRAANLEGAHAGVVRMELYLYGMHIGPYEQAGRFGHENRRPRKLLAHKREIERLMGKVSQKGFTLVPIRVYFKKGRAKIELGIGRGLKQGDERQSLRRKMDLREARDAMARGRGRS